MRSRDTREKQSFLQFVPNSPRSSFKGGLILVSRGWLEEEGQPAVCQDGKGISGQPAPAAPPALHVTNAPGNADKQPALSPWLDLMNLSQHVLMTWK